jgi:hypothetical protein
VQNSGFSALGNSVASLYLDNARVAQQSLDIAARHTITPSFQCTPKRRGIQSGYLQLEDDAFDADNKRYFTLNVPNSLRVLAVGATANDVRLSALALTLDRDSATAGLFSVEQTTEAQLASFDLSKFDLLMCVGVKDFSKNEAERIAQFVAAGGGMLMFPGRESDINNYNSVLFRKLGIPPSQPQKLFGAAASNSFLSFSKIDFDHPLFEGLFEQQSTKKTQPNIESPRVYTAIQPQTGARGRSLISLSDGTSFLTEYSHGVGKILLLAVEAGMTWSDFPLKGIFVPLLYRGGLYLAASASSGESTSGGQPQQFTAGEEIKFSIRLKTRTDKDSYVVRSPSGIDERIVPQFSSTTGVATFTSQNSFEAGIYELRKLSGRRLDSSSGKEGELLFAVAVNVAKEETDLRHVSDDEIKKFTARIGLNLEQVRQLAVSSKIDAAILESRFGVELWKYFVGLAIVLALLEMIVGRESKERRAS